MAEHKNYTTSHRQYMDNLILAEIDTFFKFGALLVKNSPK